MADFFDFLTEMFLEPGWDSSRRLMVYSMNLMLFKMIETHSQSDYDSVQSEIFLCSDS